MGNLRPAVLRAESVVVAFGGVDALRGARIEMMRGELLAIVGESGAGKTTLLRALAGLVEPVAGMVRIRLQEGWRIVADLRGADERRLRATLQVAWQDARDALDPAMRAEDAVAQGYAMIHANLGGKDRLEAARALLRDLGMGPEQRVSPPSRLSGGECRRVVLARALAALGYVPRAPKVTGSGDQRILLLDEPMAALDPPRRRRVLAVLQDARRSVGLSIGLVTHDLGLARDVADRVAVMYRGEVIESGKREAMFDGDGRFLGRKSYSQKLAKSLAARDAALGPGFHSED